jgi:fatty acid desaturase
MSETPSHRKTKALLWVGVLLALLALLAGFTFWFNQVTRHQNLRQSPQAGHLEVLAILFGLAAIGIAGALVLASLWKGRIKSFTYDVGLRLMAMGLFIALISDLADYIGIGAHHQLPYFGPLQTAGVLLGEVVIAIGFVLMARW